MAFQTATSVRSRSNQFQVPPEQFVVQSAILEFVCSWGGMELSLQ